MTDTESNSALKRKMEANRESTSGGGRSAAGALRLAMARAAADLFDLTLSVIGVIQSRVKQDGLKAHLSDDQLLILLDGPEGQLGAVALDRALLVALIQQQTMGCLTGGVPGDRPFTSTDAALAAPLIDATLKRATALAEKPPDVRCLSGFRFGARAEGWRAVELAMEADSFRVFELTLEFGGGPQQGRMCLMLPEPEITSDHKADGAVGQNLSHPGKAFELARADLTAVICRLRLPLAELSRMQPGDVLPLVAKQLNRTDLVTLDGQKVAAGRLGQIGGLRALRLNETRPLVPDGPDREGFEAEIGAHATALSDPMTVEGSVVEPENTDINLSHIDGKEGRSGTSEESDDRFANMTPDEAAVEISALAGLSLEDETNDDQSVPIG